MTTPSDAPDSQIGPEPVDTQVVVVEINPDPMMAQTIERNDQVVKWEIR